jgi:hypothetical protein
MSSTYRELSAVLRVRVLLIRNLNYFIGTDLFRQAYSKASENQKDEAGLLLNQNDLQALEAWTKRIIEERKDYGAYSIRALRLEAQRIGVPGYSYLSKASLLSALENEEKNAAQRPIRFDTPNCESVSGNEAIAGVIRDSGIPYQSDNNGRDGFARAVRGAFPNPA